MSSTIEILYHYFLASAGVATDTRKIMPSQLFFALKGENFDGHQYVKTALDKGALLAVIENADFAVAGKTILVEDVLATLQWLAHRRIQDGPAHILAITGSNGKTTTKELIKSVVEKKYKTYATEGNLNNHIGVPLTLLAYPPDTEVLIVEMGANHLGEIAKLCEIANPNMGLITHIGKAHLEGFGGEEGVAKGKLEMFEYLLQREAVIFANMDDIRIGEYVSRHRPEITKLLQLYGSFMIDPVRLEQDAQDRISFYCAQDVLSEMPHITTHLRGDFHRATLTAAIAVGLFLKVENTDIATAIAAFQPAQNRSEIKEWNRNRIILDAYNANPSSMMAALHSFEKADFKNKWIILGDMYELGDYAPAEHQQIVSWLDEHSFYEVLLLIGPHFENTNKKKALCFASRGEAEKWLREANPHDKTILIKGSRGMALEKMLG